MTKPSIEPLSASNGAALRLNPRRDFRDFAQEPFIPILPAEVPKLALHCPIVFGRAGQPELLAVFGVGGPRNLAISDTGEWLLPYVPARLRYAPLAPLPYQKTQEIPLGLDMGSCELVSGGGGVPLFNADGAPAAILADRMKLLQAVLEQRGAVSLMLTELQQAGVLVQRDVSIEEPDNTGILVSKLLVVEPMAVQALDDEKLGDWARRGILPLLYQHLLSLDLIERWVPY